MYITRSEQERISLQKPLLSFGQKRFLLGDPDENRPLAAARGTHASVKTLHRSVFFRTASRFSLLFDSRPFLLYSFFIKNNSPPYWADCLLVTRTRIELVLPP